ncbi:MAG: ATP-dependent helicase [Acidimicrobiales bacterium]
MVTDHVFGPGATLLEDLDPAQLEAVTTDASPLCILAGAGSGKTRVLTRRIAARVVTGSASAGHVLALTFTRRAAAELGRRLAALGVTGGPAAGTFHATAWAQLRRWWADRGDWAPTLLDRKVRLLGELAGGAGPVAPADVAAEIEWAKARLVGPAGYEEAVAAAGRRPPAPPDLLAALFGRYEEEKRRRRLVDFDDLVVRCAEALEHDPGFAAASRWRFRHLFVDELQDLNPAQFRLLEAWRGGRPDLCVVGDPDQAIYAWNGADPTFLTAISRWLPEATVVHLDRNYRSTPQVVAVANAVLDGRRAPGARDLRATRPAGSVPTVTCWPTDSEEGGGVAAALRRRHSEGRRWSEMAVLARTRAQLVGLEEALAAAGVPHRVRGAIAFLDRPEVAATLAALGRRSAGASLRTALAELAAEAGPAVAGKGWGPVGGPVPDDGGGPVPDDGGGPIAPNPDSGGERRASLAELARLMAELLAVDGGASVGGFLGWVAASLRGDDAGGGADAVTVATFHAAKGLEWPVVHLTGVEQGLVPVGRAETPEARAEERRLLYVAVTRAGEELHVSWAERRRFGARSAAREPSPWLAPVEAVIGALARPGVDGPGDWRRQLSDSRRRIRALDGGRAPARTGVEVGERADPRVLAALRSWRAGAARAAGVPAFVVLHDATLAAVAEARPGDHLALLALPGVGPVKAERYGDALLAVVAGAVAS